MKKLILVLVLILTPVTVQAVGWRHYIYWWDGLAHILHPSGDWWVCDKYGQKCNWDEPRGKK